MSRGPNVFAVSRSIWTDDDFAPEPFTEREAWIWLVSAAAWKETRVRTKSGPIALKRSEFSFAVRFLAEKFQWTKSKVDRFIHRLEKRDMIRDTSRDNVKVYSVKNYNRFQVVGLPKRDSDQDDDRDDDGTIAGQQRDKEETGETVKQEIQKQETPAKAVVAFPEIVSRETRSPSKAVVVVQSLPHWLPLDAWSAYLEMRRKKRAAPTPRAIELLLKRLEKWVLAGHDPTEILDASTRSNWTDIYEPKTGSTNGRGQKPPTANDKNLAGAALAIASFGEHDDQSGEAAADRDAGGPFLPFLDAGLQARTGSG